MPPTASSSPAYMKKRRADASDDAVPFGTLPLDLSTRATPTASVVWTPPAWTPGVGGSAQRSPELRTLLQQIVDRPGWVAGNACVLVIAGSGKRTAHSRDANPRLAPRLELIVH